MPTERDGGDLAQPEVGLESAGLTEATAGGTAALSRQGASRRGGNVWRGLLHNRKAVAGLLLLLFFLVLAVFPGQLAPYSPTAETFGINLPPSPEHWMGTTAFGQDVFSQLIWGARESMIIAFAAGAIATVIAVFVGVAAAYSGGFTDGVLSTITDILLVIPVFPLFIVIAAYLHSAGLLAIILILGALNWSFSARQLRVQGLSMRNRDFLKAAAVRGERGSYIVSAEMLPSMSSLIVAAFCLNAVFAVLTAAGLQFIGLGDQNAQSWGTMLYWAYQQAALQSGQILWALMPGVCIALLGWSLALLNFAFDEISNPALRPVRRLSRRQVARSRLGTAEPDVVVARTADRTMQPLNLPRAAVLLEVRNLSVAYATEFGTGRRRRQCRSRPRRRRVSCRGRRVRLWQVDPDLRHFEPAQPSRRHHVGECLVSRPRDGTDERQAIAPHPLAGFLGRHAERHERAQSGDDRGPAVARRVRGHTRRCPATRSPSGRPRCCASSRSTRCTFVATRTNSLVACASGR